MNTFSLFPGGNGSVGLLAGIRAIVKGIAGDLAAVGRRFGDVGSADRVLMKLTSAMSFPGGLRCILTAFGFLHRLPIGVARGDGNASQKMGKHRTRYQNEANGDEEF